MNKTLTAQMTNGNIYVSAEGGIFVYKNKPQSRFRKVSRFSADNRNGAFLLGVDMLLESNKRQREWYRKNKDKARKYAQEYIKAHPWMRYYNYAQQRCRRGSYKKNGVQFKMTLQDFKYLWIRDKAHLMKRPSVDRIDTFGDYELKNCRFIEMDEHRTHPQPRRRKPVLQYTKSGKFIKKWDGISIAEKALSMCCGSIHSCLSGRYKSSFGYMWRRACSRNEQV